MWLLVTCWWIFVVLVLSEWVRYCWDQEDGRFGDVEEENRLLPIKGAETVEMGPVWGR